MLFLLHFFGLFWLLSFRQDPCLNMWPSSWMVIDVLHVRKTWNGRKDTCRASTSWQRWVWGFRLQETHVTWAETNWWCVSKCFVFSTPDTTLVQASEHPRGDGVCLQHWELQAHRRWGGWFDGTRQAKVWKAAGGTVSFELSFPLCLWSQFVHHMIHCFLKVKFRKSDLQRSSMNLKLK